MPETTDYLASAKVSLNIAYGEYPGLVKESISRAQAEALIAIAEQMEKQNKLLEYIYDRLTSMQRFMK